MFTLIGGDGKEYGPATAEQLRSWINAGRANLETKAKLAGETEFRRLGDFPEFGGTATPVEPPPLTGNFDPAPASAPTAGTAVAAVELTPADRLTRLFAVLIDNVILALCVLPGAVLLGSAFFQIVIDASRGIQPDFTDIEPGRLLLGAALIGLGAFSLLIVQIVMLSMRGQTIGKRLLGIRIVRFGDGSNPGFVRAWLLRSLVVGLIGTLGMVGNVFTIVNYGFIFRADRRCLHDLIADTKVVKA
jgi:uncharacterized RDD family membrane protein YckC